MRLSSRVLLVVGLIALTANGTVMAESSEHHREHGSTSRTTTGSMVVFGYNDLGMHCMNQDFSEIMLLPPYNNLHAQVIDRSGEEPRIVTSGVTIGYTIPGNTFSVGKTNFWSYCQPLLGVSPPPNVGLTGNGLSGTMAPTGAGDWAATGIPLTPIMDNGDLNFYPLATVTVSVNGKTTATTNPVVPVSTEMSCNMCHDTPGVSTATAILRAHDTLHGTQLESSKPVLCSRCHADAALGEAGNPNLPSLSLAMHDSHAPRLARANLTQPCYACHPGFQTQCLRDVHYSKGMTCTDCHGDMANVANTIKAGRRPWQDEPRCGSCHTSHPEQPGTLYRNSKGHHGVFCEACHGSPHAITPTVVAADNVQATTLQGYPGTIDKCTVCHRSRPDERFGHNLGSGDD